MMKAILKLLIPLFIALLAISCGVSNPSGTSGINATAPTSSVPSGLLSVASPSATLLPPASITVTNTNPFTINISWSPVASASGYNVYRSYELSPNVYAKIAAKLPAASTSFKEVVGYKAGKYYFAVTAIDATGKESPNPKDTAIYIAGFPQSVNVAAGNGHNTISWSPVTGATSYVLYYSSVAAVYKSIRIGSTSQTSYIHNASNGITYYYAVAAVSAKGESSNSYPGMPGTPAATAIDPPTGVVAGYGNPAYSNQVISWTPVASATYNVYRSLSPNVALSVANKITVSPIAAASYISSGLLPNTRYYYKVTALVGGVGSGGSAEVNKATIPSAPASISVVPQNRQNTISWTPVAGAISYNLYASTSATAMPVYVSKANSTKIAANLTSLSYTHTGLTNGVKYYYAVDVVTVNGMSYNSVTTTGIPQVILPPAPVASKAVLAYPGNSSINIVWNAVTGATGYNLYRSTTPGVASVAANRVNATPILTTSYLNTLLSGNTKYYYVVTALNPSGESGISNEVSATTFPNTPTGVTAKSGPYSTTISWTGVPGVTGYNIYYSSTSATVTKANLAGTAQGGNTTTFTHTGLQAGVKYYYSVAAIGTPATNLSYNSVAASATPTALGTVWNAVSGLPTITFNSVAHGANGFVAVGTGGAIYRSTDGVSWIQQTSGTTANLTRVTYGPSGFVTTGQTPPVALISTNGITWNQLAMPITVSPLVSLDGVKYSGGEYVIWGQLLSITLRGRTLPQNNSTVIMKSPNLSQNSWTIYDKRYIPFPTSILSPYFYQPGNYSDYSIAAITDIQESIISDVGQVSVIHAIEPGSISIRYPTEGPVGPSYYDAPIQNYSGLGNVMRIVSTSQNVYATVLNKGDGTTQFLSSGVISDIVSGNTIMKIISWGKTTQISSGNTFVAQDMITINNFFAIVGNGNYDRIFISDNGGVSWVNRTPNLGYNLYGVAYGNNKLVTVGTGGTILYSVQ